MNHALLHLYEEIGLLALRDKKGTFATERVEYLVSGAVLAELLLDSFIAVGESKKQLVEIQQVAPQDDPVIEECLAEIQTSSRERPLKDWVDRLSKIKQLRHKVATQLCRREILRADEQTVLLIFAKKVYPEVNPEPEKHILKRLRSAIFSNDSDVNARTAVLITLANAGGLLDEPFGRREIRNAKGRIKNIANGELVGQATRDVIAACDAAVMVSVIIPTIILTCD